jgi:hypothetical protein
MLRTLLVIKDRRLPERYIKNWQEHAKHSEVYGGGRVKTQ